MVQDRAIVTMADQQKVAYGLSNGVIFNDLEGLQTHISKSGHSLTMNISKIDTDTAIVTNRKPYPSFQVVPLSMT